MGIEGIEELVGDPVEVPEPPDTTPPGGDNPVPVPDTNPPTETDPN